MPKRSLKIVKRQPPILGVCERCSSQFEAENEQGVRDGFDAHKCKPVDSSQNALRVVREATEDK